MTLAYDIAYSNLVETIIVGNQGWLSRMNQLLEIPEGAQAGSVTVTLLDAITASTIVDGTVLTNAAGQTAVAMTLADKAATLALKPSAARSSLAKPENMAIIAKGSADAIVKTCQEALIAALVAGTPDLSETLTVGQIDFTTDGTAGETIDNLRKMASLIVKCLVEHSDILPSDWTIIMHSGSLAKFSVLRAVGEQNAILGPQGIFTFMGVPIYTLKYDTNFGAATKYCAFMTCRRNVACKFLNVGLHGGGPIAASDGTTKWITIGSYVYGQITDNSIGGIINPGS
jgi:hypothetical protein